MPSSNRDDAAGHSAIPRSNNLRVDAMESFTGWNVIQHSKHAGHHDPSAAMAPPTMYIHTSPGVHPCNHLAHEVVQVVLSKNMPVGALAA